MMNGDERLIFHANVFRTSHVRWHWEAFPWWDDDATFMQNVCLFQTRVPAVITPGLQDHTGSYWYADSNFKTLFCEIVFFRRQPPCWFWIFVHAMS